MKKIIYFPFILGIISCQSSLNKKEEIKKDYFTFSGKITNPKEGNIVIYTYKSEFTKTISVTKNGDFKDTLKLPDSINSYIFTYGEVDADLFLENGDILYLTLNTEKFDESLKFEGKSAKENNFLKGIEDVEFMKLISAKNINFENQLNSEIEKKETYLNQQLELNPKLVELEKENINNFKKGAIQYHNQAVKKAKTFATLINKPSPLFINYTTPEGKLVSLSQFKGKYTYIDIWATWCGPCKAEIPSIKDFLATDDAKKMNILSISLDEEKATETWKEMIMEKEMNWLQLKADSAWNSSFISAYDINSIPRFILLDPQGNVVNPDAPRPSSNEFKTMIKELKL